MREDKKKAEEAKRRPVFGRTGGRGGSRGRGGRGGDRGGSRGVARGRGVRGRGGFKAFRKNFKDDIQNNRPRSGIRRNLSVAPRHINMRGNTDSRMDSRRRENSRERSRSVRSFRDTDKFKNNDKNPNSNKYPPQRSMSRAFSEKKRDF